MKMSQHIFALTRSEQRVVIIIMICLLLGAVGKRYYDGRFHPAAAGPTSSTAPAVPAADEEPAAPDEAR
jgi:hypothetical protein